MGLCFRKLSFSVSASLSNLGDSSLPCDLNSLTEPRRVVDFQFVQLFACQNEMITSKFLMPWTRNQKSCLAYFEMAQRTEAYRSVT